MVIYVSRKIILYNLFCFKIIKLSYKGKGGNHMVKTIGDGIAFLRKEKLMSRQQLAQTIGVSQYTILCWEKNRALPDIRLLRSLCTLFNISLSEFFVLLCDGATEQTVQSYYESIQRSIQQIQKNFRKKELLRISLVIASVISIIALL